VLFRDMRVGLGEREFGMLKFRTMHAGAAVSQAELEASNEADGPLFKIREDPRVTSVGALLRRFSLDEVPQVWNVLRGEMSLVGPRPDVPYAVTDYTDRMRRRLDVKPGITGLWQVSGRSRLSLQEMYRLDVDYVTQASLRCDLGILARTVPAVLRHEGAA